MCFSSTRPSTTVPRSIRFLRDTGHLVADAHAVFDHLYRKGDVVEVGCWSNARRYFFKALETDPDRARHALALIAGMFVIERKLEQAPPETKLKVRQAETKPIVDAFFAWCEREATLVLDETPIAKGIGYARNQRAALERLLADGRLPAHNNWSERELRGEAVGRKNWLLIGNDDAGEVNAGLRQPHRELPTPRDRALGLPSRPLLPSAILAAAPRPGALARLLEEDP